MNAAQLWVLFVSGFAVVLLVTPLFMALAHHVGLVDHPAHRKIHKQPVAYLGGPAIFVSLFTVMAVFFLLNLDQFSDNNQSHFPYKNFVVLMAASLMALWGLADDIYHL
ncbi:MAG TPA: hypothetical protein VMU88_03745, partial [bacterium]|nr:hypothetical protein [bacterium]